MRKHNLQMECHLTVTIAAYRAFNFIEKAVPDALASTTPVPAKGAAIAAVFRRHFGRTEISGWIVLRGAGNARLRKWEDSSVAHLITKRPEGRSV